MALNNAYATFSGQTIGATEISLYNNSSTIATRTDDVIAQVFIDTASMLAGDEYQIALYEKAVSGGTQRKLILASLVGAQADPIFVTACWQLGEGWDFSIQKIAGTDRTFSWSIRVVS